VDDDRSSVSHPSNLAMVMATVVIWALAFPVIKIALEDVPPITMALVRFAIASVFFLALQFTVGGGMAAIRALDRGLLLLVVSFGVIQSAVTNIAQNIGFQWTGAGVASIIQSVGPVFTMAFAIALLGERYTHLKMAGAVLAIVGTAGIVTGGGESLGGSTLVGNSLMVATAAAYAVGGTIAKYVLRWVDPMTLMAVGTPFSLIPLAVGSALEADPVGSITGASLTFWASVSFLGLFATGVTMILWYKVLALVELSKLVYFVYLIPVFSVVLSWVMLGETLTLVQVLFAALIIAGVAVAQRDAPETAATLVGAACEEEPCEQEPCEEEPCEEAQEG
jgi:drug/metabolite transporter (DMT)-like permease